MLPHVGAAIVASWSPHVAAMQPGPCSHASAEAHSRIKPSRGNTNRIKITRRLRLPASGALATRTPVSDLCAQAEARAAPPAPGRLEHPTSDPCRSSGGYRPGAIPDSTQLLGGVYRSRSRRYSTEHRPFRWAAAAADGLAAGQRPLAALRCSPPHRARSAYACTPARPTRHHPCLSAWGL